MSGNTLHNSRIILAGFMGSGKTALGKSLAENTGFRFFDLDRLVESAEGLPVHRIFKEKGEEWFRRAEHKCLLQVLNEERIVLATGGGTPCFHKHMELMNRKGLTVYLQCSPGVLAGRLVHEKPHRPLIANLSDNELPRFIDRLLREREPYYLQAKLIIKADHLTAGELAASVAGLISS